MFLAWKTKINACTYLQNCEEAEGSGDQQGGQQEGQEGNSGWQNYRSRTAVERANYALGEFELPEAIDFSQFDHADRIIMTATFAPVGTSRLSGNNIYCEIPFVSANYQDHYQQNGGYYSVSLVAAAFCLSAIYGRRRRVVAAKEEGEAAEIVSDDRATEFVCAECPNE